MSSYRINFSDMVNAKDTTNLSNMLGIIDSEDMLIITFENKGNIESDAILKVLYENGFNCTTSGGEGEGDKNNSYYITATRVNESTFEGIH